jgi:hypothetical protein
MPYYINRTDGTSLTTIQDGAVDNTTTSLSLVGKNFPTYGQLLNQNLVSLLENFAASSSPNFALSGQIWYDSSNKNINFYREGSSSNYWQKVAVITETSSAPSNPRLGDLWYDTSSSQLKIYDTNTLAWKIVGPQTTNDGQIRVTGNNTFTLQVGGNNALNIDLYGALTLPYNPCFVGYNETAGANLNTAGVAAYNTWKPIFVSDSGTNFDPSTGIFSIRTSGSYKVYVHVTTLGGSDTVLENESRLQWWKNGSPTHINASNNHTNNSWQQLICSGIIDCNKGDTLQLVFSTSVNAAISYQNSSYTIELVG